MESLSIGDWLNLVQTILIILMLPAARYFWKLEKRLIGFEIYLKLLLAKNDIPFRQDPK